MIISSVLGDPVGADASGSAGSASPLGPGPTTEVTGASPASTTTTSTIPTSTTPTFTSAASTSTTTTPATTTPPTTTPASTTTDASAGGGHTNISSVVPAPTPLVRAAPAADPTIFVATTGTDTPSCGTVAVPCATIGYAYSVRAASGDTINVAAGQYGSSNPNDTSGNPANQKYLYIQKTIHFVGAQAGVDARTRAEGGPGETVIYNDLANNASAQLWYVAAPGVTIDGFTFDDVTTGAGHFELVGSGSGGAGVQTKNDLGASGTDSDGWQIVNDIFKMTDIGLYAGSAGTTPSLVEHDVFDDNGGVINSNVNTAGIYSDHPLINTTINESRFFGTANANPVLIATGFATPTSALTISNNVMDGQASVSFYNVTNATITNNSMLGVSRGVALDGGNHQITISDNDISGPSTVDPAFSRNCIQISNTYAVGQNTDVTIFDNTMDNCVTGGISVANVDGVTIDYNLITNSRANGIVIVPNTDTSIPPGPGAPVTTGVTAVRNTITGSMLLGIDVNAGSYSGAMQVRFNRIVDNGAYDGLANDAPNADIDARWNWWGCNTPDSPTPPTHPGCGTVKGTSATAVVWQPWLILTIASNPVDIEPGMAALIASTVHTDSDGGDTTGLTTPPSPYFRVVPDLFTADVGHVSPATVTLSVQLNDSTNWPAGQVRPTRICSTVDHQTVCLTWAPLPPTTTTTTPSVTPVEPEGSPSEPAATAAALTSAPSTNTLPVTGAIAGSLGKTALALVGLGAAILLITRRRRRIPHGITAERSPR